MEAECPRVLFNCQNLEPRRLESPAEPIWINWHKRVTDMDESHEQALQTVAAHETSSRPNHAPHFTQQHVLQFGRGHVVQHGERNHP